MEIKGQLAPRPTRRSTQESDAPLFAESCIYYTKNRGAMSGIQQGQNCPEHPVIHINKHVISRRPVGTLPGTSAGLAAGVLISISILIYFHEKLSFFPFFQ